MTHSANRLLASLPASVFDAIEPHLKLVELHLGDVLAEAGSAVRQVYFPHTGIISLVVELTNGQMIETAMVGRDGVMNASSALNGKMSLNKAVVQHPGVASAIAVDRLAAVADDVKALRALLVRHEQVLLAESQQSAACNASHRVEARMCKWLLRMRDLGGEDDLTLTQEFLAQMIGVTRPSVTIVANALQKAGLIRYRRGNIRILDVAGLTEGACECYGIVKNHHEWMLAPRKSTGAKPPPAGR